MGFPVSLVLFPFLGFYSQPLPQTRFEVNVANSFDYVTLGGIQANQYLSYELIRHAVHHIILKNHPRPSGRKITTSAEEVYQNLSPQNEGLSDHLPYPHPFNSHPSVPIHSHVSFIPTGSGRSTELLKMKTNQRGT